MTTTTTTTTTIMMEIMTFAKADLRGIVFHAATRDLSFVTKFGADTSHRSHGISEHKFMFTLTLATHVGEFG